MPKHTPPPPFAKSTRAIRLRVMLASDRFLGPGKVDLLQGIQETGYIAAAGRRMKMSYKRAWQLVEEMNHLLAEPLVESAKGGAGGGGAVLTPLGEFVLQRYRRMLEACERAVARDLTALRKRLPATH